MPVENQQQGLPPNKPYVGSLSLVSARTFKQGTRPDIDIKCNTFIITQCDVNGTQLAFYEEMFGSPIVVNVVPYQKLLVIKCKIEGIWVQNSAGGGTTTLKYIYGNDIDIFANPNTSSISLDQVGGSAISLGQKTMPNSLPVVVASDQSVVPISNANLDVALSTVATQATLALVKAKTDNIDVALSTRLADAKFPATAARGDAEANPTLTEIASFPQGFNGITWDRRRSQAKASQTSAAATQNQLVITTYNLKEIAIILQSTGGNLNATAGNLTVEVSYDNVTWITVDSVALAAATSQAKQYDITHLATTLAVNPMDFPYVRLTVPSLGGALTSTITYGAKQ